MSLTKLNKEQKQVILEYSKQFGEGWKDQLKVDWLRAGSTFENYCGTLHSMRISHGAKWLNSYQVGGE